MAWCKELQIEKMIITTPANFSPECFKRETVILGGGLIWLEPGYFHEHVFSGFGFAANIRGSRSWILKECVWIKEYREDPKAYALEGGQVDSVNAM